MNSWFTYSVRICGLIWTAVSADGRYRGKYQFDRATWELMGGSGDPAQAGEAEQDRIAAKLFAQRGTSPWPVCGT